MTDKQKKDNNKRGRNKQKKETIIQPRSIVEEMKKSYLDYAMSVIVGRALPDVRDGLKPVHRRILYSMNELNLTPNNAYRKSARIVGDVLGKYHPHGDNAVYLAMVRMAQDFASRGQLVDGHGNFGSIDGDSPAAMRYTEAKMSKLAMELLRDIEKNTVDFVPNFDESLNEPSILPCRFPNLLVNGANGIAVGMATSIPPHNLREVVDATIHLIDNKDCTVKNLMRYIKGPDFPTGAMVMGGKGMEDAYETGRGKIKVKAKATVENLPRSKKNIVITEIPYQVNKAKLVEKIAELVKDKKVEGIADLRDESNREGMRIVIELKRDVNPHAIMKVLYNKSPLEDTFSVIMLAIVDGEPKILNLKEILEEYIKHQKEVVYRRTEYDLNKAESKAHILEGIKIALDNLDEVIKIIRSSKNGKEAKSSLMETFEITEIQTKHILDTRLMSLTAMEISKVTADLKELNKEIKKLRKIKESEKLLLEVIKAELIKVRDEFGDKRLSEIKIDDSEVGMKELIEKKNVVMTMTPAGFVKRQSLNSYKFRYRGRDEGEIKEEYVDDFISESVLVDTHGRWIIATDKGNLYNVNSYEIPEGKGVELGVDIRSLIKVDKDEKIVDMMYFNDKTKDKYLAIITKKGLVKKVLRSELKMLNKKGFMCIDLQGEDQLVGMISSDGKSEYIITTAFGKSLVVNEKEFVDKGLESMGLRAIVLDLGDSVVKGYKYEKEKCMMFVSENGYAMRVPMEVISIGSRFSRGNDICHVNEVTGRLIEVGVVEGSEEYIIKDDKNHMYKIEVGEIAEYYPGSIGEEIKEVYNVDLDGKIDKCIKIKYIDEASI